MEFLLQLFIFLTASSIAVPLAKKLGLGSVLGYLIAGIIIGPFGLSMIGDVESVMHFTEFGVVMMLFLVGLELKPSLLWEMRIPILGMGGAQVVFSTLVIGGIAFIFLPWQQAMAIGLTLALSSTAIVVQTLKEKGLMKTNAGRSIFSVLLFQDLAVIPMLAIMPLLATMHGHEASHGDALVDLSAFPEYVQVLITIAAILAVFLIGRYGSRPIFRIIASTGVREIFVGTALALVVGISLLMTAVGLSPALGTFLAGVVLANSEYRHELESDIEPFKGLLMGIFFISIGASLNFTLIGGRLMQIILITLGLILLKFIILFLVGLIFKLPRKDRTFFSIALAQGGEFAFVLFQVTRNSGVLAGETTELLVSAVAISMFLAPVILVLYERLFASKKKDQTDEKMDTIKEGGKVIIAGFGPLGTDIGRFLLSAGVRPVVLDHDASNIELLRKLGFEVYYGDATRRDLLESAGISEAEVMIVTMSNLEVTKKLINLVKMHYPKLKIITSTRDVSASFELMDLGVTKVRRESFGSALTMGQDVLKSLGMDPYDTHRLMRIFRKHDEEMIQMLYEEDHEVFESYRDSYKNQMKALEEMMMLDMEMEPEEMDKAWIAGNPEV